MTGMLCSNYSHGIVSQNCFAKLYSDLEIRVQLIITGTFVQVHSIQDDDVLFCIVRDDMQVEFDQMVCKKADIINVPESLWGPLFTVKKVARLPLVKDSKIAESIGNISVGHTVQVLGPDNSVICIANVTFRNSIGRLGVGIYFGLQVLSSKENLSAVIKKVSLLEPGTKGFPRGCDIVVTVDKLLPSNCSLNAENSVWNYEKENQNQLVKNIYCREDSSNGSFKAFPSCCIRDKVLNDCKKVQHRSNIEISHSLKKMINSDNSFNVGDEVIYMNGDTPEKGVVKWLGLIENSLKVGVEFDNPIGNGKSTVEGLGEVFQTKYQHSLFVAPTSLIKLSDYKFNNIREDSHFKKNHNNSNNNCSFNKSAKAKNNNCINNNNEFINSSDFCYSGPENSDEKIKKLKKVSVTHQCLKHVDKSFDSNNSFQAEGELSGKDLAKNHLKSEVQHSWKNFDAEKSCERKISCRSNSNCVDDSFVQTESSSSVNGNSLPNFPRWNSPPHNIYDLNETNQERIHCFSQSKVQKCPNEEDEDSTFYKTTAIHPSEKNNRNFPEEQSNLAKKANCVENESIIYDVPSRDIRRIDDEPFSSKDFCPSCRRNSSVQNFNEGRRDSLAPSTFNFEINELTGLKKDKWECQYSQASNSDEHLRGYCEALILSEKEKAVAEELGKGSMVELTFKGKPHFGVIRWIGTVSDKREDGSSTLIAGVEMEEESADFTDGILNNKRYFQCNPHKGLFVPLSKCRKDSRFLEDSHKLSLTSKVNYGQIDCPVVEGTIPPINTKGDIELICGKNRGIQGHHNSCYLDATLFSMFAFTSVFDSLLYRPPTSSDIPQYNEVQRVLREEIVNPLRKNLYVRADRVMKLRTLLEKLSSISGLTSEEKDPEEFLNSLLAQILKAEPFLKLSSGQEAFHYQLFVEKDERLTLPSVQLLFEQSFVTSDIKLKQVPSCLIIQMPRFGKAFKMYSRILPPQLLDITDIIENSPRQCTVCGKLAEFECKDCFGQQGIGNGLESISFCKACLDTAHNHHCRSSHNSRALTVPVEFYELQDHCVIPRLFMELFAVVCIETSHYVAFVKCGSGSDAPWCFFDSMADRKGEQNGYNIPEMVPCPDLTYWLSEEGVKILSEMQDDRQLPEHAKRLFSDAYMCMYQSPDLMMYR